MKPKDLVEHLLGETDQIQRIVDEVEQYLGDVIDPDMSEEDAREECWTLCIDKANDIMGRGPSAIAAAKEACHRLGYTPVGYRPKKEKAVQPVWPPQFAKPGRSEPERVVKPTGVVHGPYKLPSYLKP